MTILRNIILASISLSIGMHICAEPIHEAAFTGEHQHVQHILDTTEPEDRKDLIESTAHRSETPLHIAALKGHYTTCKLLLDRGADVHASDSLQHTPLHKAIESNSYSICKLLLEYKADPNRLINSNESPLVQAILRENADICTLLLAYGAYEDKENLPAVCKEYLQHMPFIDKILDISNIIHHGNLKEALPNTASSDSKDAVSSDEKAHWLLICIRIMLAYGKFEYAQELLHDVHRQFNDPVDICTDIWLHAETLRSLHQSSSQFVQHLDVIIHNLLKEPNTLSQVLYTTCKKINNHAITPRIFKYILERYHSNIHDHFDNIDDNPKLSEHRMLRDLICKKKVVGTAHRVRRKEATQLEMATCIDYCIETIKTYRDPITGNTFLHELAYNPAMIQFVPHVARLVIQTPQYKDHNSSEKTPKMIAKAYNNYFFQRMFDIYDSIKDVQTPCIATTSPHITAALYKANPHIPAYTAFSRYMYLPLTVNTLKQITQQTTQLDWYKLSFDNIWDIIEMIYETYTP